MAITYPLSLPSSPSFRRMTWNGDTIVGMTSSIFTFSEEIFEHVGNRWEVSVGLPPMTRAESDAWAAFLFSLYGMKGTFLLGDQAATSPRGSVAGTPLVNGANAANAKVLETKGWTGMAQGVLLAGDKFQLGTGSASRLHMVLADVDADSGGLASVDIWPRLRTSYADGAAIVTSSPKGVFRLADNRTGWDVDENKHYGMEFSCIEAVP